MSARWWSLGKIVGSSIIGPIVAMLPFVLKVTDDCVESLVGHAVWLGGMCPFHSCFLNSFIFSLTEST